MVNIKEMKAEVKAEAKANKQPRVIKVKTLIVWFVILTAISVAFIGGIFYGQYKADSYHAEVKTEAKVLVQQLKSAK